jgi:hypothetical protein
MRPLAWAENARRSDGSAIGQDNDRALGIEKTDDVVVIGDAAPPMRDMAQTSAADGYQTPAVFVGWMPGMTDGPMRA